MNLLLDSHIVLWWLSDDKRLSPRARRLIERADEVFVSAATTWELALKVSLGKLRMPEGFLEVVEEQGFVHLPITPVHAMAVRDLPRHHRDPFDCILLAQAMVEGLRLVSADRALAPYGRLVVRV
ncbi:type II toxin-antitoxin system VapC family toxin [Meiothermus sp. QL-1]|uniref:type II toxin-antitoxin system VapC family toxin n=1 Tax=Meiothermus sp. QL-1 TaxID=2058095 RepID=UPI000E0AA228|nr:type II toxin-antitoxin system VapC family toxin [Meiothermus sp. QL-1]RDI96482.1 type II toxin-antitoxin system VapC family toxin [Meiothermus sp. QL-1]